MYKILGVGVATLDIINTVEHYPREDEEVRALSHTIQRGGNVSNTLCVLSQFKHGSSWAGVIADDAYASVIRHDFKVNHVAINLSVCIPNTVSPVSHIVLSAKTAKRTIVHYRDLPEFSYSNFSSIPLADFDWIHFEGRNIDQTLLMLRSLPLDSAITVSVEIEKPRDNIHALFEYADVIMFSRAYVLHQGYESPEAFLDDMHEHYPDILMFCAWGEVGAYAIDQAGHIFTSEIKNLPPVVDTLGAGDVFNAGVIHACLQGLSVSESLEYACALATKKCGQIGFSGLTDSHNEK